MLNYKLLVAASLSSGHTLSRPIFCNSPLSNDLGQNPEFKSLPSFLGAGKEEVQNLPLNIAAPTHLSRLCSRAYFIRHSMVREQVLRQGTHLIWGGFSMA